MRAAATARKALASNFFILTCAAALIFGFLLSPTIDFDEGYFFQSAVHATTTGYVGLPWVDAYFGGPHLYVPLNSLVPLLNWPLAYLPNGSWLLAGRLLSGLAVCGGIAILLRERDTAAPTLLATLAALFVAFCLPLILVARTIRPDALVFLLFCAALYFARRSSPRDWLLAGLASGLTILAHTVHGAWASLMILVLLAQAPDLAWRSSVRRVVAGGIGIAIPLVVFYGLYVAVEGPSILWEQMKLLVVLTPRASSLSPLTHVSLWASQVLGQINTVPLLAATILAVLLPIDTKAPRYREAVLFKLFIVALFLFWIFVYPKKQLNVVVLMLPLAWHVFVAAAPRRRLRTVFALGLAACVAANAGLLARYHWRLLHEPGGMQQIEPIARALAGLDVVLANKAIMTKSWLLFALARDLTLWDITVFPRMMRQRLGANDGLKQALARSDAIILERMGGTWVDPGQAELAGVLDPAIWKSAVVKTRRYFTPVDIVVFTRRAP